MRIENALRVSFVESIRRTLRQPIGRWAGSLVLGVILLACARPAAVPQPEVGVASAESSAGDTTQPSSDAIPVRTDDAIWGTAQAPVTIVAFLDFECPFCARVHPTLTEVLSQYGPKQVRLVVKHAPLPFHQRGVPCARAAQAVYELAGAQPFLNYVALLFAHTDALSDENLLAWAQDVGVSPLDFARRLNDPAIGAKIDADTRLSNTLGIDGVPAFLVNGASLVGARPVEDFTTLVEHELRATAELLRRGVAPRDVYQSRVEVNVAELGHADAPYEDVAYQVPIGSSPVRGPENAPVTIVEFADFECPFCQRAHQTVEQLFKLYPGKLRWVMKHNPLPFHAAAVPAAVVALEARRQKGAAVYWQALDLLYAADKLDAKVLLGIADQLQLELSGLRDALDSDGVPAQVQADQDLAMDLEATGTPYFFVNGRRMSGAQPLEVFKELVDQELEQTKNMTIAQGADVNIYQALQARALPAPGLVRKEAPPPDVDSPVWGSATAPVTIQMFADFECGYCRRALPTIARLHQAYPGKIRVVWRNLPLAFHRNARQAAAAALEAQAQLGPEGFWKMSERLLALPGVFGSGSIQQDAAFPDAPSDLSVESLKQDAQALGLDMDRFVAAINDGRHLPAIQRDEQLGRSLGVRGTPAFFINGYSLSGAQPLYRFDRFVRLALQQQAPVSAP